MVSPSFLNVSLLLYHHLHRHSTIALRTPPFWLLHNFPSSADISSPSASHTRASKPERKTFKMTTSQSPTNKPSYDGQASTNYKEAFALFDKRGNSRVSLDSLGDLLRACGQNPTLNEIRDLEKGIGGDCTCNRHFSPNQMLITPPRSRFRDLLQDPQSTRRIP